MIAKLSRSFQLARALYFQNYADRTVTYYKSKLHIHVQLNTQNIKIGRYMEIWITYSKTV
jgi:hypothetical protein